MAFCEGTGIQDDLHASCGCSCALGLPLLLAGSRGAGAGAVDGVWNCSSSSGISSSPLSVAKGVVVMCCQGDGVRGGSEDVLVGV